MNQFQLKKLIQIQTWGRSIVDIDISTELCGQPKVDSVVCGTDLSLHSRKDTPDCPVKHYIRLNCPK